MALRGPKSLNQNQMNNTFNAFLKRLTIFSAIVAACGTVLYFILPVGMVTSAMPFILLFFMAHTVIFHRMATRVIEENLRRFSNFYMISTIARLFLFLAIMIVYSLSYPKDAKYFIVCFFLFYVIYTFFELYTILPLLRQKQSNTQNK